MLLEELTKKLDKATESVDISKYDLVNVYKVNDKLVFDIYWKAGNSDASVKRDPLEHILYYYDSIDNPKVKDILDEYQEALL